MSCGDPGYARSKDGTRVGWFRTGAGPPLVLVHGTTADHSRWEKVVGPLSARATVYAVDRRGRGASADEIGGYTDETEALDVAAVVDAIDEPVTLLGHSFGGLCVLEAALRTENIRALVLYEPYFDTGHELAGRDVMERITALLDSGDRDRALTTFMLDVVGVSPEVVEEMRASPSWQGRIAAAHTITREDDLESHYRFDPSRFEHLSVPTLLLSGSESPPALTEPNRVLEKTLPDARPVVMEGEHHVAMNTNPDLFVREVLAFLDRV